MGTVLTAAAVCAVVAFILTPWTSTLAGRSPTWLHPLPHVFLAATAGAGASLSSTSWAETIAYGTLGVACALLFVIDVVDHRLPDRIVLPMYPILLMLLVVAAVAAADWARLGRATAAGTILLIVYFAIAFAYPPGMGLGDVKLAGLLGLFLGWLGWSHVLLGVVAGFILNALVSLSLLALRRVDRKGEVPFGPSMIVGAAVGAAWGPLVFTGVA